MDDLWTTLGLHPPDWQYALHVSVRLAIAATLGGLLGLERQVRGHAAGLRTHMLVSLGSAMFALVPFEAGASSAQMIAEVVRGVAPGIGFLGAGAIMRVTQHDEPKGLTTAATIWLTAAVGISVGVNWMTPAVASVLLGLVVLELLHLAERKLPVKARPKDPTDGRQ